LTGLATEGQLRILAVFLVVVMTIVLVSVAVLLWITEERILTEIRELDRKLRFLLRNRE